MTRKRRAELACAGLFGIVVAWWLLPWWLFTIGLVVGLLATRNKRLR